MKETLKTTFGLAACLAISLGFAPKAQAASQTAQSAMVAVNLASATYQIEGTITWTYDRDAAETHYINAWDGNPPVVTVGSGAAQTSPGAPAPDGIKLQQHAQAERCTFFCGGSLTGDTYTQTVNGTKGWKWVYTYNISPNSVSVDPHTCWAAEETGGTVDVGFDGFVSSESFLKNGTKTKYSFTLLENDVTRVRGVTAQLQSLVDEVNNVWSNVGLPLDLNNADTDGDTVLDGLTVSSTVNDYSYYGNVGVFGNSAVYSALHAPTYLPASGVDAIMNSDNFANNNNDLASGNVHEADYSGDFPGLTEAGSYRIVVSGTIKGNTGSANVGFSVASSIIIIGGCACP